MKRFLIIILIVLAIAGVVYAGYTLSTKKNAGNGTATTTPGGLPEATPIIGGEGQPGGATSPETAAGLPALGTEQLSSFGVASDTSIIAAGLDGKIFKISADGSVSPLSASSLDNFVSAAFSYDAQKVVLSFGTSDSRQFSVFDIATRSWTPLAVGVVSASWKPRSHVLAYATEKSGLKTVFSLDMDVAKAKPSQLFSLRMEDLVLDWAAPGKISISQKPSGLVNGSVFVFDTAKKTFSSPVIDVPGAALLWDSAASRALEFFGSQTARGGDFRIVSASGETINKFQFLTLPEKCLFVPEAAPTSTISTSTKIKAVPVPEEKNIICAVPSNQTDFTQKTLPDEYYKRSFFTADNIYKINLDDGTASLILSATGRSLDASSPLISGDKLFILNRADGKIYSLPLPK
ncbi:MAG: hypothetical protein LiPW15_604 [Parcubacteria group bacterium LiPW_15]|nr:MAG: hypothetical protein LiPW15_604 [Parcubacteria group bacterium LiPW_15]